MIGYVTLGANDLARAAAFYVAILGVRGVKRMMENETFIAWGEEGGGAGLGLTKPFDGNAATVGNGAMAALACESREQVDAIYRLALSLGAADEGAPGPRQGPPGFYAGYFRDPEGNKLNAFTMGEGGKTPHVVGYATLGTNDIARATEFYGAIAETMGAGQVWAIPTSVVWSTSGGAAFDITKPFDGAPATVGNGVMVALECKDRAQVDAVHATAMALGGKDEGAPGERWPGFYAGYFRDRDGNKLNAFIMG
jgi:catechol 2,3-dioxygenase-like lactoylglutathione lyase family enzyme